MFLLCTKAYKQIIKILDYLHEALKDFDLKTAKDPALITRTSERLNSMNLVKFFTEHHQMLISAVPLTGREVWAMTGVCEELAPN